MKIVEHLPLSLFYNFPLRRTPLHFILYTLNLPSMILRADPDQSSPNKTELGLRLSCNLRKTVVFIEIQ